MEFQTCLCGSTIFETIVTKQYDATEFYIDSRSKDIRTAVAGVPAAKCIQCGRISVPSTSMAGISVMDPRVGAYRELLRAIEVRNNAITCVPINLDANIQHSVLLHGVVGRVETLENKVCGCKAVEEVPVVEATTRGGKKSKVIVSGSPD